MTIAESGILLLDRPWVVYDDLISHLLIYYWYSVIYQNLVHICFQTSINNILKMGENFIVYEFF